MQLRKVGEYDILWTPDSCCDSGIVFRRFGSGFGLLSLTLQRGLFLLCAFSIALGAAVTAQSGRTFCASSPLRPGATSNSTL